MAKLLLTILCTIVLFSGCALIMNGPTEQIAISSNPDGATVFLDNEQVGVTPMKLTLPRSKPRMIVLRKEGYNRVSHAITQETSSWFWAGLISLAGPFELLSFINNSLYDLTPKNIFITLEKFDSNEWRQKTANLDGKITAGEGWKDLRLAMPIKQTTQILGIPDHKFHLGRYQVYFYYSKGLCLFVLENHLKYMAFTSGGYYYPRLAAETGKGIGFHSTRDQILKTYGSSQSKGKNLVYRGIAFFMQGKKVRQIIIFPPGEEEHFLNN